MKENQIIIIIDNKFLRVQDVGASYTQVRMCNGLRHYVYFLGYNMHAQYVALYSAISSKICNERSTVPCKLLALPSQYLQSILANLCVIAQEHISIIKITYSSVHIIG